MLARSVGGVAVQLRVAPLAGGRQGAQVSDMSEAIRQRAFAAVGSSPHGA